MRSRQLGAAPTAGRASLFTSFHNGYAEADDGDSAMAGVVRDRRGMRGMKMLTFSFAGGPPLTAPDAISGVGWY